MKRTLLAILLLATLASFILGAPVIASYGSANSQNSGIIILSFVGYETRGDAGPFMCAAQYNQYSGRTFYNPLAPLFPSLITDC